MRLPLWQGLPEKEALLQAEPEARALGGGGWLRLALQVGPVLCEAEPVAQPEALPQGAEALGLPVPEALLEVAPLWLPLPLLLTLPEADLLGAREAEAQAVAEASPLPEALLLPAGLPEPLRDTEGEVLAC